MKSSLVSGLVALSVLALSAPALAKQEWATYEGPDAVQVGQGGTKITKNGIDYWTSGSPPRRFQVLGILTDARKDRLLDGNVIGSKSVAKKAKEAGGDAVIVAGASAAHAGTVSTANVYGDANGAYGTGFSRAVTRTTTQLIVVKYLDN